MYSEFINKIYLAKFPRKPDWAMLCITARLQIYNAILDKKTIAIIPAVFFPTKPNKYWQTIQTILREEFSFYELSFTEIPTRCNPYDRRHVTDIPNYWCQLLFKKKQTKNHFLEKSGTKTTF